MHWLGSAGARGGALARLLVALGALATSTCPRHLVIVALRIHMHAHPPVVVRQVQSYESVAADLHARGIPARDSAPDHFQ